MPHAAVEVQRIATRQVHHLAVVEVHLDLARQHIGELLARVPHEVFRPVDAARTHGADDGLICLPAAVVPRIGAAYCLPISVSRRVTR